MSAALGVELLDVLADPAADHWVAPGRRLAPDAVIHPLLVAWLLVPQALQAAQEPCRQALLVLEDFVAELVRHRDEMASAIGLREPDFHLFGTVFKTCHSVL